MKWIKLFLLSLLWTGTGAAFELQTEQVTEHSYALVGEIGPRSAENHGLNNTLGFVLTAEGVVLIGSGATPEGAKLIEAAVAERTEHPIRWVINIGAQDHHWMGNSYFIDQGIEVIALARTAASQQEHIPDELQRLQAGIGPEVDTIKPLSATRVMDADRQSLKLGGVDFELIWPGAAHFEGDAVLWLPQQQVIFTGDLVFHDRMLGVQPYSQVSSWQQAFQNMAELKPRYIVPGHGFPGDLSKSRRDTGDYLDWLMLEVGQAIEDWEPIDETVDKLEDAPQFKHLQFYDAWHRRNINRTYLELEAAQ